MDGIEPFVRIAWEHPMFHISRKPDFAELKQVMVDIFKTDPQRTFVGQGTAGWDDMPGQTDLMIEVDLYDDGSPFPATIWINFLDKKTAFPCLSVHACRNLRGSQLSGTERL